MIPNTYSFMTKRVSIRYDGFTRLLSLITVKQ